MGNSFLKNQLQKRCLAIVEQRIATANEAVEAAAAAANEATKSSAGDKYETTRAMMHLEKEKNVIQLAKALQLKNEVLAIESDKICTRAEAGSLVITDSGTYYLAVGLGKVQLDGQVYYCISAEAPIGALLYGKSAGDAISFQGKDIKIISIY